MMNNKLLYLQDGCRANDLFAINNPRRINSKIEFFNDATGEPIWEPLHNKTVIAGAALTLQKLFNLNSSCLNSTPTYNSILNLRTTGSDSQPSNESLRHIIGFCVGSGGAGLEVTDVFEVPYASWITPDNLVPFRYPLTNATSDGVDRTIYKGALNKTVGGQSRTAYYFKTFSNTPTLVQNYVSTLGTSSGELNSSTVYDQTAQSDRAQSYVELSLKISEDDCREFYIAHSGLEQAKVNQISLVYGYVNNDGEFCDVRPFSICNFPTQILSDREMTVSIAYTLYC